MMIKAEKGSEVKKKSIEEHIVRKELMMRLLPLLRTHHRARVFRLNKASKPGTKSTKNVRVAKRYRTTDDALQPCKIF